MIGTAAAALYRLKAGLDGAEADLAQGGLVE